MPRGARVTRVSLLLALVPACGEATATAEAKMAAAEELGDVALVEEHEQGNVVWRIDSDGQVKAAITASSGVRMKEDVGVLHVPAGSTAELVASARASTEIKLPGVAVGPHGGSIQGVGEDRLERVADETTGEVRVYALDVNLRPVSIEGRTLKIRLLAERPEMLVLAPASAGFYFAGKLAAAVNPLKLTVALGFRGTTRVALRGHRPGMRVIAAPARAPRIEILVKRLGDGPVDVHTGARADVDVRIHDGGHGGDEVKAMIHDRIPGLPSTHLF